MKRFENGSLLLENDEDKKAYTDTMIAINNLIEIARENPKLWAEYKDMNPDLITKLRAWLL